MNKVLVIGSKGQLGSDIKQLIEQNFDNINESFDFSFVDIEELDITKNINVKKFFKLNNFDFIVNCAAYTNVDKAETDKENAYSINADSLAYIVNSIKESTKLIHISTDYVFDGNSSIPYTEEMVTSPTSIYGNSKLKGEQIALQHKETAIIRTSWLYSNFGHNFAKTMLRLAKERNELKVVFDQVGTPTYAKDLAKSIINIIIKSTNNQFIPGIYHFSNEGVCSWYDFALQIINKTKSGCKVIPIESVEFPTPVKRPNYSVLNKKKIKENYNLTIPHWTESLDEFFENL